MCLASGNTKMTNAPSQNLVWFYCMAYKLAVETILKHLEMSSHGGTVGKTL